MSTWPPSSPRPLLIAGENGVDYRGNAIQYRQEIFQSHILFCLVRAAALLLYCRPQDFTLLDFRTAAFTYGAAPTTGPLVQMAHQYGA